MKTAITSLLVLFVSHAYGYTDSLELNCASAQSFVAENGPVVLATGKAFAEVTPEACMSGVPAFVRTKDVRYCWVGYNCHVPHSHAVYMQGTEEHCQEGRLVAVMINQDGSNAPATMQCQHGEWVTLN